MNPILLIPARMASTRLPGKPWSVGQASAAKPSGRATKNEQGRG